MGKLSATEGRNKARPLGDGDGLCLVVGKTGCVGAASEVRRQRGIASA
jgi:hypothetical protein